VSFEGKKDLSIKVGTFENSKQQYQDTFKEFNQLIAQNINPDTLKLIHPDFSNTSPLYSIIFNIATMDCLKSYFNYKMYTECGIRNVKMTGTEEDWVKLVKKTEELLTKFDFDWWSPYIIPILQEFLNTYKGQVNVKFWDCSYKAIPTPSSRGYYYDQEFTGWIMNCFPYNIQKKDFKSTEKESSTFIKSKSLKTLESLYILHDKIGNQHDIDQQSEKQQNEIRNLATSVNDEGDVPLGYSSTPLDFKNNKRDDIYETLIDASSF